MFARNDQHGEACHHGQVVPEDDENMTLLMNATDKGVVAVLFFRPIQIAQSKFAICVVRPSTYTYTALCGAVLLMCQIKMLSRHQSQTCLMLRRTQSTRYHLKRQ